MTTSSIRLHAKLYRAAAIEEALTLARERAGALTLRRRREGDYHLIEALSEDPSRAEELLAEVADVALVITVDLDRR